MFDEKFRGTVYRATAGLATRTAGGVLVLLVALGGAGCPRATPTPSGAAPSVSAPAADLAGRPPAAADALAGGESYRRDCSPCHGLKGDGQGPATRFLYAKPRNFRTSKFRLVSTVNGVPTPADVDAVLVRGVPGASMPSFPQLDATARGALVGEVLRLRGEGLREAVVQRLRQESPEDELDADEVRLRLDWQLTPGAAVAVPEGGPPTGALVQRGQEVYVQQNCPRCHGRDGTGDSGLYLSDEEGFPTRPRNLQQEDLKGGPDPRSIAVRIRLGLPGTPMAANPNLSADDVLALVHYIRSLGRDPKWQWTNYQRAQRVLERGFLSPGHPR